MTERSARSAAERSPAARERMTLVVMSLGSNLGDRAEHLIYAVERLGEHVRAVSGVYETPPWGDADQPSYLNAVVLCQGPLTPRDWLRVAQEIEKGANRVRDGERRFGPRTLDVDLIAAWDDDGAPILCDDPDLTLPHPRAHLRAFVLRPWLEIQPFAQLPGYGWVNDLVLSIELEADVAAMLARPDIQLHLAS